MKLPNFEIYQDQKGEHRWRLKAANGRILADSAEGYSRKRDAQRAAETVFYTFIRAQVNWEWGT